MKKFLSIVLLSLLFNGSALAECIKGDCKKGYGEFSWKGLGIYKGEWLNSKMHGYGEYEGYPDGSHAGLTHKGYYKNDKKHGDGKFTHPNGAVFEGEYRNNKMKLGKFTWPIGSVFEGEFRNDKMKLGKFTWPNGDICEEYNGSKCLVNIINKEKLKKQKAEEEKLKAKKKAEEEKLAAKQKAKEEEEKKRLLEEKIKQQKALDEKKLSLLPAKPKEKKAKKTLIDIQKFIKNNPNEFDILEISEFFIKTKPILENSFNDQLEKDLNSLIEYVKKSKNFQSYLQEIEFKEREKNLKYIDEKLSLINKQIAKVTNFLYEKPNSIHAENWLNSVKKAKQKLKNFNSFEEILSSSNELGTIIINKEILVKSNSESEKLIIELKGYLANNLTTDLTPKILEQIENIKKSVETENVNKINMANEKASNFINKIFLEPKKKAKKKKEKENEKLKKKKAEEAKKKKALSSKTKTTSSSGTDSKTIYTYYYDGSCTTGPSKIYSGYYTQCINEYELNKYCNNTKSFSSAAADLIDILPWKKMTGGTISNVRFRIAQNSFYNGKGCYAEFTRSGILNGTSTRQQMHGWVSSFIYSSSSESYLAVNIDPLR